MNKRIHLGGAALMSVWCALVFSGCNTAGDAKLVPAGGLVKYKGAPVAGATVTLLYPDKQVAVGITGEDGRFTLTTGGRPGAPIGKAKVAITKTSGPTADAGKPVEQLTPEDMMKMYAATKGGQAMKAAAQEVKNELPAKYANPETSPLEADVQKSGNDFLFDLQD
ncbi:MAG: hypothetical protein KatS3mg110_3524 [Pirellulaceae bacterium]|nr:MAG: hypothetical protein KatS3mg110_3524 [Pirellulaceae bacterium]